MPDNARAGNAASRWFADRKVGTKILIAVSSTALVACGVGAVAISKLSATDQAATSIYEDSLLPVADLSVLRRATVLTRLNASNVLVSSTESGMDKYVEQLQDNDDEVGTAVADYSEGVVDPAKLEEFSGLWKQYQQIRDTKLVPAARRGDIKAYEKTRDTETKPITDKTTALLTELFEEEQARAKSVAAEAHSTYTGARSLVLVFLLLGLLVGAGLALFVSRLVTAPLRKVSDVLKGMADGDLTQRADVDSRDEVGQMAGDLNEAVASVREAVATMSRNASALGGSSEELTSVSTTIAASAEQASAQANVVSAAAEQVSRNVQTVATGAEEMGASIREIAQNANEAARVAATAVEVASATNVTVSKLGDSSRQIGEVVKVITSIAEQTNLLALNATIEAARAGEAGKGFAVVANEVKDLAQETAKATEDISRMIQAIQGDTAGAVDAIGQISAVIAQINDYQTTIASAVEEQTATTNEMSRSVAEAATGSTEIAANIIGVAQAAETTSSGVVDSQRAASELAQMSQELTTLVGTFRV